MIDRSLFLSPDGITFDGRRAVPNEEVTALMLSLADLQPGEKVLEIGTGSGYQTCCLAASGATIYTIDREKHDGHGLDRLGADYREKNNIRILFAEHDGKEGSTIAAPFDCIFVSCGMTSIPPAYEEQLREGGRLIIPLGKPDGQELLRLEKRNGKLVLGRVGGYCRFQMAI